MHYWMDSKSYRPSPTLQEATAQQLIIFFSHLLSPTTRPIRDCSIPADSRITTSSAGRHRSTIDYIFLSPTLANHTSHKRLLYSCGVSDYDLLSIDLRPPGGTPRGKGVWRCNKFHIRQPEFAPILKQALDHLFARPFRGTDGEAWERVKKRVKSTCISYSSAAKQRKTMPWTSFTTVDKIGSRRKLQYSPQMAPTSQPYKP